MNHLVDKLVTRDPQSKRDEKPVAIQRKMLWVLSMLDGSRILLVQRTKGRGLSADFLY